MAENGDECAIGAIGVLMASGRVDLPVVASEAFYGGLQDGTRAIVHCCLCGAGTQWNASSMVARSSPLPRRRLRCEPRAAILAGGRGGAWRARVLLRMWLFSEWLTAAGCAWRRSTAVQQLP